MSITQLQNQIKEGEDKLALVEQSKTGFDQQLSALRAEEQSLIVSARTGDEAAKARLSEVRKGIDAAQKESQDDAAAISTIASQVETLRASLASEQNAAARLVVLRKVAEFTKRAKANRDRISAVASELRAIGDVCVSDSQQVCRLLVELNEDRALRGINVISIELNHLIEKASALLEKVRVDAGFDCMDHMQRFIGNLEHATRELESEEESILA